MNTNNELTNVGLVVANSAISTKMGIIHFFNKIKSIRSLNKRTIKYVSAIKVDDGFKIHDQIQTRYVVVQIGGNC